MTKEQFLLEFTAWYQLNKDTVMDFSTECESKRKEFLKKFPLSTLRKMSLEDYAIGKHEDTFCYWVENELKMLGSIRGRPAAPAKFGIYFDQKIGGYSFLQGNWQTSKFGETIEEVFENVRSEILNVAAHPCEYDRLAKTKLNPMFANKIAFLYSGNKQIPIYSDKHLDVFLYALGMHPSPGEDRAYKREKLYHYYSQLDYKDLTPVRFMKFLYEGAGLCTLLQAKGFDADDSRSKDVSGTKSDGADTDAKAERAGLFVPGLTPEEAKCIGRMGEAAVKEYLNRSRIRKQLGIVGDLDCPCETNDYANYDFSYQTADGNTAFIEVKATKRNEPKNAHFYMSAPEYRFMQEHLRDYWIFYVNDVLGKKQISRMRVDAACLSPSTYEAKVPIPQEGVRI